MEKINENPEIAVVSNELGVAMINLEGKPLNEQNIKELCNHISRFAVELRKKWDNNNWFPCGFVSAHIEGNNPLVRFIKKHGTIDGHYIKFSGLEITKDSYRGGYVLYVEFPQNDAIAQQSMSYKQQVYQELVKGLALMGIPVSINSQID